MSLFLDATVILIVALTAIAGFHKGFVKYVISMLGTVASVIVAFVASDFLTAPVYEKYVEKPLESAVQSVVESVDIVPVAKKGFENLGIKISESEIQKILDKGGNLIDNVSEYVKKNGGDSETVKKAKTKFSSYMNDEITKKLDELTKDNRFSKITKNVNFSEEQLDKTVKLLADGNRSQTSSYITESVFAPAVKSVLKILIFIIAFILAEILIKIILAISGLFTKFSVIGMMNHFGGLLLGIVKGGLYIALIAFLMCLVVNSTSDSMDVINSKTADNTYLFRYFFDFFYK